MRDYGCHNYIAFGKVFAVYMDQIFPNGESNTF
jgi:hypothetical protein